MAIPVTSGASLTCSFGAAPGSLIVPPAGRPMADQMPMANIMDFQPNSNITPFGMCSSLANPQVAAATAAAQGALTPQPCIPFTIAPWVPGSPLISVANQPALNNTSTCNCGWGGVITVSNPGPTKVQIP